MPIPGSLLPLALLVIAGYSPLISPGLALLPLIT
jgi:hypothetical protein